MAEPGRSRREAAERPACCPAVFGVTDDVDSLNLRAEVFDMNLDLIRKKLGGGFQPFVIRTSDGREFKVPHPEFITVGKYAVAVVDADGDIDTIAALHIASIKDLAGRRSGRRSA